MNLPTYRHCQCMARRENTLPALFYQLALELSTCCCCYCYCHCYRYVHGRATSHLSHTRARARCGPLVPFLCLFSCLWPVCRPHPTLRNAYLSQANMHPSLGLRRDAMDQPMHSPSHSGLTDLFSRYELLCNCLSSDADFSLRSAQVPVTYPYPALLCFVSLCLSPNAFSGSRLSESFVSPSYRPAFETRSNPPFSVARSPPFTVWSNILQDGDAVHEFAEKAYVPRPLWICITGKYAEAYLLSSALARPSVTVSASLRCHSWVHYHITHYVAPLLEGR
ncbi:hypothetical protein F4818DRAFT_135518 [Hypoxylon cercidicola]|nr:hypothetical protein F4818DRAFT_135518 [Hypoxylon cercidicola]